jgi:thiol:disulfide interchange protein
MSAPRRALPVVVVPWWWSALTGVLGGGATLAMGVWLTHSGLHPDPFAMVLITAGAAGLSGVSSGPHLRRLAVLAARTALPPGRDEEGPQ